MPKSSFESYPPLFRPSNDMLPIVDMQHFESYPSLFQPENNQTQNPDTNDQKIKLDTSSKVIDMLPKVNIQHFESYPPLFRPENNQTQNLDTNDQQIKLDTSSKVIDMLPKVDMQHFESYPPLFRPEYNQTQNPDTNHQQIKLDTSSNNNIDMLPIVDMQDLDLDKLNKVCKEYGIFRLVNHGIPRNLLKSIQEYGKKIFDKPYEDKEGIDDSTSCPIKYLWGSPALTLKGEALRRWLLGYKIDWLEGFNVSISQLHNKHASIDKDPLFNDLRKLIEEYGEFITNTATTIYKAMIESLKLDGKVDKRNIIDESSGLIRVYRYPKHNNVDKVQGLHAHTDNSILSILSEDEVGGLKFLKDDRWYDVQPVPDTLVVNLGDMMQVVSDDKYKSVEHKVELNKQRERLSICYFVFPDENIVIESPNYKPFTYKDFKARVQLDLETVGHKMALQSFKI